MPKEQKTDHHQQIRVQTQETGQKSQLVIKRNFQANFPNQTIRHKFDDNLPPQRPLLRKTERVRSAPDQHQRGLVRILRANQPTQRNQAKRRHAHQPKKGREKPSSPGNQQMGE